MQREREAVDSEFEMALPSDYNRKEQIFGSLSKSGHPMSKFMWGNLKSLQSAGVSLFRSNLFSLLQHGLTQKMAFQNKALSYCLFE
jgi:secreted Zn-dependent insulinase-like peptidase